MQSDVLISWDFAYAFRYADQAKKHVLVYQLNDAFVGPFDWEIDAYFHPSKWHQDRFLGLYPEMDKSKCFNKMTNGIDYERYTTPQTRQPHRVIYSSSPDRGLHHLLRLWPKVVEAVPDAELHVFYDMDKWLTTIEELHQAGYETITSDRGRLMIEYRKNPPPNVTFHGGVGQRSLAIEQMKSSVMAYPCDPVAPTEGFSMSVLEGIASGCSVLITDADAFPELWSNAPGVVLLPLPVDDNIWADAIVKQLCSDVIRAPRLREDFAWSRIARKWEAVFNGLLGL
jgi:glycosyltransferase involved in cell wall biosynthesis